MPLWYVPLFKTLNFVVSLSATLIAFLYHFTIMMSYSRNPYDVIIFEIFYLEPHAIIPNKMGLEIDLRNYYVFFCI